MKANSYKKYFILITYTLLLAFVLINIKHIFTWLWQIILVLTPLWIGIALAFILNVPMMLFEKKVLKKKNKTSRILSIVFSIMIIVILLMMLFVWVIPDLIESATYFVGQIPSLMESLNKLLINTFSNTELSSYLKNFTGNSEVTDFISNLVKGLINNFTGVLSNLATFIINLVTGIIIAVYFLLEKEAILRKCKKIEISLFDETIRSKIDKVMDLTVKYFNNFITYQCLECLILGTLMFIVFVIFRFPYALTIAFLTGITAIIPIIGATIACVIGAILIGTINFSQAIMFVIVFQIVQQIENNFIYPKVVGKNVGLPPILTILALIIGEKVAGFIGMIVCIPITAILHSLVLTTLERREEPILKVPKEYLKN